MGREATVSDGGMTEHWGIRFAEEVLRDRIAELEKKLVKAQDAATNYHARIGELEAIIDIERETSRNLAATLLKIRQLTRLDEAVARPPSGRRKGRPL